MPNRPTRFPRRTLAVMLAAFACRPGEASAHAILMDSQPPIGGKVVTGRITARLRFNSRIDRARSAFTLTRPDKTKVVVPIDPDGPPDLLTTTLDLKPGVYVLRWQVLAVDGHVTRGDLPFTVTSP